MGTQLSICKRLLTGLVLALGVATRSVSGGPDHAILPACLELYKALRPEQRHSTRDLVQDLQAIESYLGHLRLGRSLPVSSVPLESPTVEKLQDWKTRNMTSLQQLLEQAEVTARLSISAEVAVALAINCMSTRLRPHGFMGRPTVSILLNYFKRPSVVNRLAANMQASCKSAEVPCELVVNVDNPEEAAAWAAEAGFVVPVFSNNLHESRGYNRAARLARGRYLVIWQDDQVPPPDGKWLLDMIKVFDAYPQLAILGMNCYRLCKHYEPTNRWGFSLWDVDPVTGVRWTFAQTVDFAPMAIRASIYEAVGGLDEGVSRAGDCGIWGDWELSTRVWMDGWQVGHVFIEGRTGDGDPGTTHQGANGEKCWGRQQFVSASLYNRRFGARGIQEPQCERVWLLNMLTFALHGQCPYNSEQTKWGNCTQPPQEVVAAAAEELRELSAAAVARGRLGLGSGLGFGDQGWHSAGTMTESKRLAEALGAEAALITEEGAEEALAQEAAAAAAAAAEAARKAKAEERRAHAGAAGRGGVQKLGGSIPEGGVGFEGRDGTIGIMDINPILVRAAGSAASGKTGRLRRLAS